MKHLIVAAAMAILSLAGTAATPSGKTAPLKDGMIKVAFAISPHVNVMDIAGPWEVFADTSLKDAQGKDISPYQLYTVAATKAPLQSAGANHPGLTITPDYDFVHAPTPDIVVVPAQHGGPELQAWLNKIHARHITIMSVCTGAFQLAKAGLLDGKQATTHHWYFGSFRDQFPKVKLVRQVRYVQADPITFTAGGLTSGVDLALHMVTERFGQNVAQQTADYMEYLGSGWKTNHGIPELTTPVSTQDFSGTLESGERIVLHMITHGASHSFATDIPAQHVAAVPTTVKQDGEALSISFAIPGHPATFTGRINKSDQAATGAFAQDGKSSPLTLKQQ